MENEIPSFGKPSRPEREESILHDASDLVKILPRGVKRPRAPGQKKLPLECPIREDSACEIKNHLCRKGCDLYRRALKFPLCPCLHDYP
jgi:hypothetical protein